MKAPDKTKVKPYKLTIKSVDGSPDTVYVQLDKVKELIEKRIAKYKSASEGVVAAIAVQHLVKARAMESLLEQLEGLE